VRSGSGLLSCMAVLGKVGMGGMVSTLLLLLLLTMLVPLLNVSGHLLVMLVSGSGLLVEREWAVLCQRADWIA